MRILAFNAAHDSAVCSINDGNLEFFCKEERLSRVKRDKHPFKALELYHSMNFGSIDHVLYLTPSNHEPQIEYTYRQFIKKKFGIEMENFSNLQHHLCHASLAFHNSGFKDCLIVVIDRSGSIFFDVSNPVAREAESIFLCKDGELFRHLYKSFSLYNGLDHKKHKILDLIKKHYPGVDVSVPNSLGIVKVYEAATTLIGQDVLENGKTMGLSSYGQEKVYDPLFIKGSPVSDYFTSTDQGDGEVYFYGCEHLIEKNLTKTNYQFYADCAKHVQVETQRAALDLIKKYVEETGIKNVCLVGGYGLNVVANNYYIQHLPDVNFYFEPVADDTGIPLGAAMLKHAMLTGSLIKPIKNNFYHYYDPNESAIKGKTASIKTLCKLLIDQHSLAIFDGAPEAGPRALGHRSILFNPRNPQAKDIVNKIKRREWYRPFAGVILESEFEKYFHTLGINRSESMTVNFHAKDQTLTLVPGIIHVDGTCRIQTVSEGFLFDLLTEFYKQTGCPMLLNTSFNLAGQPLVQTKKEALETLNSSVLDAVYFVEDKVLVKNQNFD